MSVDHLVIMGVSGCGKSTVGRAIAARTGRTFVEADDHHSPTNRAKMAAGIALTDADRAPWLDDLVATLDQIQQAGGGSVLACSALRRSYRDRLRQVRGSIGFALLHGSAGTLTERMEHRHGHYMPASLLDSQLETLELPTSEPDCITIDIDAHPDLNEQIDLILTARFGAPTA